VCGANDNATCMPRASIYTFANEGSTRQFPSGRAMCQMMGVFAEFERAIIREQV